MKYQIENTRSGHIFGIYEGETPEAAIQAMMDDAGSTDAPSEDLVAREIVIVNDGATTWGTTIQVLEDALAKQGWEHQGAGHWVEPEMGEDDDPAGAYTELCQDVAFIDGLGPDDDIDRDDYHYEFVHYEFVFRPDWGRRSWQLI